MPLDHLQCLEAEAIHILREVVATFRNPVMLYSIGKDSSVLLHLAMKAFYPAKPPFPFLHVDTDLEIPRDDRISRPDGEGTRHRASGSSSIPMASPKVSGRSRIGANTHTHVMKTIGLQASARQIQVRRGHRRRPARRGKVAGEGTHPFVPQCAACLGSETAASGNVEDLQYAGRRGRDHPGLSAVELDRARRLAIHHAREHSDRAALFRAETAGRRARRHADHGRRRSHAASSR